MFHSNKYKKLLNNHDLRATPTRLAIVGFLDSSREPAGVRTIIQFLASERMKTDPATVFRIMNVFTKKGITIQVQFHDGKARYELVGKGDHHHLICEHCGKIEDIYNCTIPRLEEDIRKKNHFFVRKHVLEFFGICSDCQ